MHISQPRSGPQSRMLGKNLNSLLCFSKPFISKWLLIINYLFPIMEILIFGTLIFKPRYHSKQKIAPLGTK